MDPQEYDHPFSASWPVYHDHTAPATPSTLPDYLALDVPQVDASSGPSRVLTRRQRAALEHAPGARRVQPYDPSLQRHQAMYITSPVSISRPQTPPSQPEYPLALAMPPVVQPSPSYHPLTPSSASTSPYSTYGFYSSSHSRSNSISNTTNPRSASPALSTASALTSVSSSASGPNSSFALPHTPDALASRAKQKKQRLFNVDRKDICLYHKANPDKRQEDIARIYGVERSTISKILKNKVKWLNVPANENLRIAKHRPSKFPEIEEEMVKWLFDCREANTLLSDSNIRNKAKEIARELGIQEDRFKASSGWIENFKHRHGVRAGVWTGEGKNIRAARAMGLALPHHGDVPPLLSPLNAVFTGRHDDDHALPEPRELSLSPEPEEARVRRIAQTGSGDMVRPSWLLPQHQRPEGLPAPLPPPPLQQPHPSVPPSRQLAEHSPYNGASVYDQQQQQHVVYDPPPHAPPLQQQQQQQQSHVAPSLAEAEAALSTVLHFFDANAQARGMLQPGERDVLTAIKCALFEAASGIPAAYDRAVQAQQQQQMSAYEQQEPR